jgi:aspartate carbamoyltransferase regulatory subunit
MNNQLQDNTKRYIGVIANGINIDHIPHGNAWYIMKILNLFNSNYQIGVGLNLPSKKIKIKDLIKIENHTLNTHEIEAISLFCVGSTLSIIKDYVVVAKETISLSKEVNQIIICPNNKCISREYVSKFITTDNKKYGIMVTCHYCEQTFPINQIQEYNF